ncbi:TRAP transporter small permease [Thermodesulfobacteriota bacterium]
MLCLTSVTLLQVFFRYVFNSPFTWPEEIAILFLVYLVFTGTGYLYKLKGHIAAKYLLTHLRLKYSVILSVLIHICIFLFAIFFIIADIYLIKSQSIFHSAATGLPRSLSFSVPAFAGFIMIPFYSLEIILDEIKKIKET